MSKKKTRVETGDGAAINQPFAGLAALRDQLAGTPAEKEPQKVTEKPKEEPQIGRKVVLSREKKGRSGKTMTRVTGLDLPEAELEELAKGLKRGLGCGAIVEGSDLLLQGAQGERAQTFLEKQGVQKVVIGN